jgi:hypothetical protein
VCFYSLDDDFAEEYYKEHDIVRTEMYLCTKEDPWTEEKGKRACHPDAIELYEDDDGQYARHECPHCKKRFWVEFPQ